MATYTYIDVNDLLPGEPVTSAKMLSFNDRAEAIAEGASGAPQIQTAAIANDAITTAKIANSAVDTAQIANDAVTSAKLDLRTSTDSATVTGAGSATVQAPGNLVFMPRVSGNVIAQIVDSGSRPALYIESTTGSSESYTVYWYYLV